MKLKYFSSLKNVILILLFFNLFLRLHPTFATEKVTTPESSNAVYQFIRAHEYMLAPLTGGVAGLSICGPMCCLAGVTFGTIDEVLLYYGVMDKRYMTYALLGGATGNLLNPALMTSGVIVGGYISGAFTENEKLAAPLLSATLGLETTGLTGLCSSMLGSITDSFLIEGGWVDAPMVTSIIVVPLHLKTNLEMGAITTILSSIFLNSIIQSTNNFSAVMHNIENNAAISQGANSEVATHMRVLRKLSDNYDTLIPPEQFNEHLEKNIMSLIGSNLLIYWVTVKQLALQQNLEYLFEHLDQAGVLGGSANPFIAGGGKLIIFIVPWTLSQIVTGSVEKYFEDRLSIMLKDSIQEKLYSKENLLRLSRHGNFSLYMDNLNQDTSAIANMGSQLFSNAVATGVNGAYGTKIIMLHSRGIIIYTFIYQIAMNQLISYLVEQDIKQEENIKLLRAEYLDYHKDIKDNIRAITERDGIGMSQEKVRELSTALIEAEGARNLWYMAIQVTNNMDSLLRTILNYCLVGREIARGNLNFEDRNKLRKAIMDEGTMFSWMNRNLLTVSEIEKALDRLTTIKQIISAPPSNDDQIQRIVQEGEQLIIDDLEIGVGDRILVTIDSLLLDRGKAYVITGASGCGKTSFLSKIRGIKENGIYGRGTIYYPKINSRPPRIVMLGQQDYLPPNSSLQELLAYPAKVAQGTQKNQEQQEMMLTLLAEVGLERLATLETELTRQENWRTLLSGGEKKKILLLSAILQKPDILILDEVFNGLDATAVDRIEQMLKKYLPQTLILVVDHNAEQHNIAGFYQSEIHFTEQKIKVSELSSAIVTE